MQEIDQKRLGLQTSRIIALGAFMASNIGIQGTVGEGAMCDVGLFALFLQAFNGRFKVTPRLSNSKLLGFAILCSRRFGAINIYMGYTYIWAIYIYELYIYMGYIFYMIGTSRDFFEL